MPSQEKFCLTCRKPVQGRVDKRFCDDYCRNTYNNQQKAKSNNYVRRVNYALMKNRRILQTYLSEEEDSAKVHREELILSGFQFRYHTHYSMAQSGECYRFCYDYGYRVIEGKWCFLIRQNEKAPAGWEVPDRVEN